MTLSHDGILNYYHFDKLGEAKGNINLKSANVSLIRFTYANAKQATTVQGQRPVADVDDEFRITMANQDTFIFRASKAATSVKNPSIEKWEKAIRKFS